jgi:Holliday junction resolvasome RuvABC DNA-binding subunit
MVVELRDKLAAMETPATARQPLTATGGENEVVFALTNLGYDRSVAENAVDAVRTNGSTDDFETLLRASLHRLRNPKTKATRTSE